MESKFAAYQYLFSTAVLVVFVLVSSMRLVVLMLVGVIFLINRRNLVRLTHRVFT
jgi:hypothetical protein